MFNRKFLPVLLGGLFFATQLQPAVPSVRFRRPDVPGFLESMEFQTVQMQVFPREVSGMVPDVFSDLLWNPAFVMQTSSKTAYFDFHSSESGVVFPIQGLGIQFDNTRSASTDGLAPSWFSQTAIRSVQITPLYHFGILLPVGSKFKIDFFNRSVFDYGPFLQGYGGAGEGENVYDKTSANTLVPQRIETDHNQQTVLGNQVEAVIGYQLAEKWNLGFRLGHMAYDRHGDLMNDRWAKYPHSSFGNLQNESLIIGGHHVETGLGLLFRPDSTTRIGLYGGFTTGNGSEKSVSTDTSRTWSERDVAPQYYDINYYFLKSEQSFTEKGCRPQFTLIFEKQFSEKWMLRSFFKTAWSNVDVTGNLFSSDTTLLDQTYDQVEYNTSYFRRHQGHGSRTSGLNGDGTEESRLYHGFVSVAYAPNHCWSLFGGIHAGRFTLKQQFNERSHFRTHNWDEYSIYKPETSRETYFEEKDYTEKNEYSRWSLYIPVGIRVKVVQGFSVLLGTGVAFAVTDESAEGERLYPVRATRKCKNGKLIVSDDETNRYELFSSNPAKMLSRQWGQYFGLTYQHASGAKVFLRFAEDFSRMSNWAFGFEMNW